MASDIPNRTEFELDDLTVAALTWGDPSAPLALCLHGFPEHAHSWRYQLPALAELGYEAWAPNLRGYGNSTRPPRLRDYAIEQLLQDVAGLIDAAGGRPVTLLGHDWGAVIS